MPAYVKNSEAVLFIHIPKTGGSSLSKMLTADGWTELCALRGMKADRVRFFRATPQHWDRNQLHSVFDMNSFARIATIVRHPFERMRSEYYWQRRQGFTQLLPTEWVDFVMAAYRKNPYVYDNHIRPQHEFLTTNPLAHTFKLENDGVLRAFLHLSGHQSFNAPFAVATEKKSEADLSIDREFTNLRRKIEDLYRRDMTQFGY